MGGGSRVCPPPAGELEAGPEGSVRVSVQTERIAPGDSGLGQALLGSEGLDPRSCMMDRFALFDPGCLMPREPGRWQGTQDLAKTWL